MKPLYSLGLVLVGLLVWALILRYGTNPPDHYAEAINLIALGYGTAFILAGVYHALLFLL